MCQKKLQNIGNFNDVHQFNFMYKKKLFCIRDLLKFNKKPIENHNIIVILNNCSLAFGMVSYVLNKTSSN